MEIGERIKQLIDKKRVTPYEVYIKTGISQSTLSRITRSSTAKLNIHNLETLAKYFNVEAEWLKTGEGEMTLNEHKSDVLPEKPSTTGGDEQGIVIKMLLERIDELSKRVSDLDREIGVKDHLLKESSQKKVE